MRTPDVINILCVDDRIENLISLEAVLSSRDYRLLRARSGPEAIEVIKMVSPIALVLLDVQMPGMDGFETAQGIRQLPGASQIPIIFITANHPDELHQKAGYVAGAVDYLYKPIEPEILRAKVKVFSDLNRQRLLLEAQASELQLANSVLKSEIAKREKLQREREVRSQFVATLVHDLRNPLSAAQMTASMLQRKLVHQNDESINRACQRTLNSLTRVDKLIMSLLDVNRIEAGKRLPLQREDGDLIGAIRSTVDDLNALHGDRIHFHHDAEVIPCVFDPQALRRVFENLIVNAIKYGSPEKVISVTAQLMDGDRVRITVHNDGRPIPESEFEDIFEPYGRAKSAEKSGDQGWGLGLALVKGIAEAHEGRVFVESDEHSGTSFHVELSALSAGLRFEMPPEQAAVVPRARGLQPSQ